MPSLASLDSGPISVSSLLEVVADDLQKLNTNLKSVSSHFSFMVFPLLISTSVCPSILVMMHIYR
jgi:hypothetical protein